ncbi:unnamed protein product [Echinostoma caproni]|uniref:Ubiquitin-like domain-containing protein n=1 Tax=Echinostoma caproni TaxID=27848 RepID=A0A183AVQ2_9TREM|nr:unnamed protein product [Echinostoma caproni]
MTFLRAKVTRLDEPENMTSRYIGGFDADASVGSLFPKILDSGESPESFDIQCICCGELLEADKRLSDYDIDAHSLLQFLVRPKYQIPEPKGPAATQSKDISFVLTTIAWIIRRGHLTKVSQLSQHGELVSCAFH